MTFIGGYLATKLGEFLTHVQIHCALYVAKQMCRKWKIAKREHPAGGRHEAGAVSTLQTALPTLEGKNGNRANCPWRQSKEGRSETVPQASLPCPPAARGSSGAFRAQRRTALVQVALLSGAAGGTGTTEVAPGSPSVEGVGVHEERQLHPDQRGPRGAL